MPDVNTSHVVRVMRALAFVTAATTIPFATACSPALPENCPRDTTVDRTPCDQLGQSCAPYTVSTCTRCGYNDHFCGTDGVTCRCEVADGGTTPTWSCTALCALGPLTPPESAAA